MLPSRLLVIAGLWARAFSYKTVDWRKQHLNSAEDRFPDFSFAGAFSSTKLLPPLQSDAALYLKATSDYKDR